MFFSKNSPPSETEEKQSDQESVEADDTEEQLSEILSVDDEEEDEDEESNTELDFNYQEINLEDRLEFHQECRKVFIQEWLQQEGDWFSKLKNEHLVFLRDVLNIPNSGTYSPSWNFTSN